jgi:hypothetical protein
MMTTGARPSFTQVARTVALETALSLADVYRSISEATPSHVASVLPGRHERDAEEGKEPRTVSEAT